VTVCHPYRIRTYFTQPPVNIWTYLISIFQIGLYNIKSSKKQVMGIEIWLSQYHFPSLVRAIWNQKDHANFCPILNLGQKMELFLTNIMTIPRNVRLWSRPAIINSKKAYYKTKMLRHRNPIGIIRSSVKFMFDTREYY